MKTKTKLLESTNKKSILVESRSSFIRVCTDKENNFFQNLLRDNEISSVYGKGIYKVLFRVPWLEFRKKDLSINRMQGFYKDGQRHDISYLAGNHRAFCMITKSINEKLKQLNQPKIFLSGKSVDEQVKGVERLIEILAADAPNTFNERNPFFQAIMANLGESKSKGERIEKTSEKRLIKKFGKGNVHTESGFGKHSDADGVDGTLKIDGVTHKTQIKPFTLSFIEDGKFVVLTSSSVKTHNVDFMIFSNNKETLVFKNQNTELGIDAYRFPVEDLIYTIT